MALFKIFKGRDGGKLTNPQASGYIAPSVEHDGYTWYDTKTKYLYIDTYYGENNTTTVTREPINAYSAMTDSVGSVIKDTYATKLSISGTTLKLQNTAGTDLSSVTLPSGYVSTTGAKGDILYWSASNTPTHLTNASSTTKKFLSITSQVPSWVTLAKCDVGLGNVENKSSATIRGELTSSNVTTALGFTPYNATNPSGYTTNTGTVTKVTAGTGLKVGTNASGGDVTTTGTINHINSVTAQTTQALYPIKIDACGHISAYGTAVTSLPASDVYAWAKAANKPSYSLSEITDASDVQAIEALTGTSGFLKKTAANTWSLDTTSYVSTANGVTNVAWDGTNKKLTKTINGSTTDVVTASTLKTDLGLSSAMLFMGSLGTGGTITSLPAAASGNQGYTYKVITAGTYASQAAKVGDVFISNGSSWILIPSGDEPSGTVTSVGVSNATNGGLTVTSSPITTSGTISIGHTNVLTNAQTTQALYPIKIDKNGHISAYGTAVTSLPASDVSAWAKAATKPSYTFSEIGSKPTTLSGYGITDAVTDVAYDSSTYNITKTINGTTSNVYQMPCIAGTGTSSLVAGNFSANVASGNYSFAAGTNAEASGVGAVALVSGLASQRGAVAIGSKVGSNATTTASGIGAIAIGFSALANNTYSIALGYKPHATGICSIAIGAESIASANYSLAFGGRGTKASSIYQTTMGKWNIEDDQDTYAFIIGNGTADNARSNALTVDWNGNLTIAGSLDWSSISNTPTTVAGYGITDVPTISIVRW